MDTYFDYKHKQKMKKVCNYYLCNTTLAETQIEILAQFRRFLAENKVPVTSRSQLIRCALACLQYKKEDIERIKDVIREDNVIATLWTSNRKKQKKRVNSLTNKK